MFPFNFVEEDFFFFFFLLAKPGLLDVYIMVEC